MRLEECGEWFRDFGLYKIVYAVLITLRLKSSSVFIENGQRILNVCDFFLDLFNGSHE
jgi:hypothetical protein